MNGNQTLVGRLGGQLFPKAAMFARVGTPSELPLMSSLSIGMVTSAAGIPRAVWERLCPPNHPFLNLDFLSILEHHGAAGRHLGWVPRHLVATHADDEIVGLLPLYVRFNSHGDFIHDWSWASAYQQIGRAYYPKLLTGLPHTPAAGPRLLVKPGPHADEIRNALIDAALKVTSEFSASSWHVAFPEDADYAALREAGLLVSHNVQFHWQAGDCVDFTDYLATFTAEKRRKVRAERRRVAESGLAIEVRHGHEIDAAEWPRLHALYASTFEKFNNYAVFTPECFADLGVALGRRMVVFIARDGGKPVAVSLCFRSDEVLYGRYWGCHGNYHSLHFELCFYQGIEYCLREHLRRFEPGAGGEHKVARGFTPTVVRSVHWIADPAMRRLIGRHLDQQGSAVEAYRQEAAEHLPFRNAT